MSDELYTEDTEHHLDLRHLTLDDYQDVKELMVAADALPPLAGHATDDLGIGLDLGIRTGLGDDRLRIGPTKVFSDGSLIGHTCALSEEFADTPGERGYLQDTADALRARILDAHRSGWRVATHAIGDAAIDLVLDAYEEAQRRWPRPDVRHRIEHFGVSRPDQVARCARLGVVPVNEPSLWVEVTAPHRAEAFDACQFVIDEMKQKVPIWKKPIPA